MVKFGLIVPGLNAGAQWGGCLGALDIQTCQPDIRLLIDSSSTDKTVSLAKSHGFMIEIIERTEFNHGGTRQYGLGILDDIDVVVYLTQDAVLANPHALHNILAPFVESSVAAVCGRQLPRAEATPVEAHARLYNYVSIPSVRSISDASRLGLKTAFISNSFAAYSVLALKEVGGFPSDVIFGEDMYVAAKMLKAGYKIAYAADACVYHSHSYSPVQEMQRYFDMGVFHAREPWIRQELGSAEGEGLKFVFSEYKYLLKNAPLRVPEGMLRMLLRYSGFRLGLQEKRFPLWMKRFMVMNKGYFKR